MPKNNNLLSFLKQIKEVSIFRFSSKNPLAQALYKKLSLDQQTNYLKFLKSKIKQAGQLFEQKFFMNELYVFADISMAQMEQSRYFEICAFILQYSQASKISALI